MSDTTTRRVIAAFTPRPHGSGHDPRGVAVSEVGLALTVIAAGAILALSLRVDALVDATTYAVAIAAIGALNVAGGAWQLLAARRRV